MRITSIRFHGQRDRSFLSYVSVVFDDVLAVNGIKIIERPCDHKRILAMPSRACPDGQHKDIAHPIRADFREVLADAILSEYDRQQAQIASEPHD